ncbi:MAG: class I tRNA ligase family protein [Candidatus Shapirobacteria bacterium]|nr:class I tRNA ligase family protein [Candidatus Shapirobacteria bacterium]
MNKQERQSQQNGEPLKNGRTNDLVDMIDVRNSESENSKFPHIEVEKKWADKWVEDNLYKADDSSGRPKYYVLDMYPYPSGSGLHVGHVEGYTATDIISRYKRMSGFEVMHPMGWDSFGLPTENFAIKTGRDPHEVTEENIKVFKRQCIRMGLSIDWNREIDTSKETYYKWTQKLFLELFEKGLAYKAEAPVNWCTGCNTVISNEQVVDLKCERCDSPVETKKIEQWFFKITDYAERLIEDLDKVDWSENSKLIQRNWIGKTDGYEVSIDIVDSDKKTEIFTTDLTNFNNATFVVLAPESPLLSDFVTEENKEKVDDYVKGIIPQSAIDRKKSSIEKTGVFTGSYIINPINEEKMPIWVADYVQMEYGKGITLGIPLVDKKDKEFAQNYGLKMSVAITDNMSESKILEILGNSVNKKTLYKLRDWLVSRERYWGAPIPIIHCDSCGDVPVPEDQLPVLLPKLDDFKPTGVPPLAKSKEFLNTTCPCCGGTAQREAKTLDTFVDSAWYYLRFADPKNTNELGSKELLDKWLPLDYYVGGADHLTGHLMYSRFIIKVLYDLGEINFDEPFTTLKHIGMISGEDGRKMSKRWGNSVNPVDVANEFGSDALRLFEMFMGPLELPKNWSNKGIIGPRRFIDKVWQLKDKVVDREISPEEIKNLNPLIEKITSGIESNRFNTAVSEFMKYLNTLNNQNEISKMSFETFMQLLAPFAPFITEEIWKKLGHQESIHRSSWPETFKQESQQKGVEISLMINGRFKGIIFDQGWDGENINSAILGFIHDDERFTGDIEGVNVKNIIYKKGKVINIVT